MAVFVTDSRTWPLQPALPGAVVLIGLFAGIAGLLGTPLVLLDIVRSGGWHKAKVIPARVVRAKYGSWLIILTHLALIPVGGVGLILSLMSGSHHLRVEYVRKGRLVRRDVPCRGVGASVGDVIWIATPGLIRPAALLAELEIGEHKHALPTKDVEDWFARAAKIAQFPFARAESPSRPLNSRAR